MALRPIRCFTCGRPYVLKEWKAFENLLIDVSNEEDYDINRLKDLKKELEIFRECCAKDLLSSVDHQIISAFYQNPKCGNNQFVTTLNKDETNWVRRKHAR